MTGVAKQKPKKKLMTKKRKAELKAKLKEKKLRVKENQKKNQKLEVYSIPSTILEKYKQEVFATDNNCMSTIRNRCHQQSYEDFSALEVPNNSANFLTAFKHATDDRNYKMLYELLSKALKIRNTFLLQQIYEVILFINVGNFEIYKSRKIFFSFISLVFVHCNSTRRKNHRQRPNTFGVPWSHSAAQKLRSQKLQSHRAHFQLRRGGNFKDWRKAGGWFGAERRNQGGKKRAEWKQRDRKWEKWSDQSQQQRWKWLERWRRMKIPGK